MQQWKRCFSLQCGNGAEMAQIRFLVTSPMDPSARFRVGVYLPRFRAAGLDAEVLVLPETGRARRALYRTLSRADSVVLLRRLLIPHETWLLRRAVKRLVFEYDDALLHRDSARGATRSVARVLKFGTLVRMADCVVAGSSYLSSLTRPFRRPPAVIPTVVDPVAYPARHERDEGGSERRCVVGWIGSRGNLPYLEAIASGLGRVARDIPFTLKVMADASPGMAGLDREFIEFVPWEAKAEAEFLQSLDVGLMPLFDDAWCRGKCGLKALQYMATGVPVLASDVGVAQELIGGGGLVVRREAEWVDGLKQFLVDVELRRCMGNLGRVRVETEYSPDVWFGRLYRLYMGEGNLELNLNP